MMGTQRKTEHGVIQSSIALLQERFKQLQRVKEMREKRELRMFSDNYKNSTTTTTTTSSTVTISSDNNNSPSEYSTMQYKYDPSSDHHHDNYNHDDHDDLDDELQVFLPPNYYNYYNHKPSFYQSSSSSSLSSQINNHINNHQSLEEVSLSLWPSMSCNMNATADHFRRTSFEAPISKINGYKFEDHSHVSDVDTTLHL